MALLTDMSEAVVANLAKEIQENRPEDSVVPVDDLGHRLDYPEWIIRVTGDMLQNRAFGVGTLPSLQEMPVPAKLFIKDVEGKFFSIEVGRDAPLISLMRRSLQRSRSAKAVRNKPPKVSNGIESGLLLCVRRTRA